MNGIINVYKEKGYTSFDVVAKLRGILREKKIGHTGTLDPDAEGVLPVCVGNATKVCELLTDKDKEYEARLHLGLVSDTGDATGTILEDKSREAGQLTEEQVREAILHFVGDYDQIPPMYSALKVNGKKLCDLARTGITVERKPRRVHIYGIEIKEISLPYATFCVHCSKGTYIRTLCEDIGKELGVGGLMESLVRTRVSRFALADARTLSQIEACRDAGALEEILLPVDAVFETYPALHVVPDAVKKLCNGNRLACSDIQEAVDEKAAYFRLYDADGRFYGLYGWDGERGGLKSKKMFL
jgi:tRNA pseudouridine55 synthase